jgi:hypothetical protein
MKTVKLKIGNGCTLAHPMAALGPTPSGAIVFEVVGVPDDVATAKVIREYQGSIGIWLGDYSVAWNG